jgi:hypothetical protein
MGEKSEQIEQHIRDTRSDLNENFSELQEKVKTAVDWRVQFGERPGTMMALAFGGGVLLAALFSSSRPTRRRYSESRGSSDADRNASEVFSTRNPHDDQTSETWNALKGAIIGTATAKLAGAIEEILPGFAQEFNSRGRKHFDQSTSPAYGPVRQRSTAAGRD